MRAPKIDSLGRANTIGNMPSKMAHNIYRYTKHKYISAVLVGTRYAGMYI